ncbi:MAG: 2Fe-2S iron-sulfur cluster binding domain-containing protein [Gammaproteobacteria bacterium]|nr:MAG: 2Fe-2S iron-sulfur cluster binding domain-containing protein [Gammaproteobacteria bacterium]
MAVVRYSDRTIEVPEGETLLSALEGVDIAVPNSCRAGLCHSCMMVAHDSPIPEQAQAGLSAQQIAQNYFLACQCYPESDMDVSLGDGERRYEAVMTHKEPLNQGVLRVRFETDMPWFAGQYTSVWKNSSEGRSFSIASLPDEGHIELHVRRRSNGVISSWLEHELQEGERCHLSAARGHCFYNPGAEEQTLLLAGTGTGLAPLYGVARQALAHEHQGDIHLYAASGSPDQLYLVDELVELSDRHENFYYHRVVKREAEQFPQLHQGDLVDIVSRRHSNLKQHRVYLCGAPGMVKKLQKLSFLQGAAIADILADAFEAPA